MRRHSTVLYPWLQRMAWAVVPDRKTERMSWFITLLAEAVMVPYVGWGIYTLRRRYRHHDEFSLRFEAGTLLGVGLLFIVEVTLLRYWGSRQPLLYFFALLGLCLATIALYGHIAISFASRLLVDMVFDSDDTDRSEPRTGPAEALEREKDYAGALQEYLVLARIYPGNPTVLSRVAENYVRLDRHEESVPWFERAIKHVDAAPRAGVLATRLAGVLHRHLGRTDDARAVLDAFIERFPGSKDALAAGAFLAELAHRKEHRLSDQLTSLADAPGPGPEPTAPARPTSPAPPATPDRPVQTSLTALEAAPILDPVEADRLAGPPPPLTAPEPRASVLAPLEAPITADADVDRWDDLARARKGKKRLTLEPMVDAPPPAHPEEAPTPLHVSPRLEPMNPGDHDMFQTPRRLP